MDTINVLEIFEKSAFEVLNNLGIDPYSTIFISSFFKTSSFLEYYEKNKKRLPDIESALFELLEKDKRLFLCPLKLKKGLYFFDQPEVINASEKAISPPKALLKRLSALQRKLSAVNNVQLRKIMETAKKNADFVARFNGELFFKNVVYRGEKVSKEEVFKFFSKSPYYKKINLSPEKDKAPFLNMYALTFYECSPKDLFTVDGIFSAQVQRSVDNYRTIAGNDVYNLIARNDKAEIDIVFEKMGLALVNLAQPLINPDDLPALAENYAMFIGLSEIGRVMAEAFFYNGNRRNDPAMKIAVNMKNYIKAISLCDRVMNLSESEDYRETEEYKQALIMDKKGLAPYVKLRNAN